MHRITPFLWFATEAEQAAHDYVSIFPNSRITAVSRYGDGGPGPKGTVMTVAFELDGEPFIALNGQQSMARSEAVSFVVSCTTQDEVDHFWDRLGAGGTPSRCGWLTDCHGVTWQIVPTALPTLLQHPDPEVAKRVVQALLQMGKLDIATLEKAAASGS